MKRRPITKKWQRKRHLPRGKRCACIALLAPRSLLPLQLSSAVLSSVKQREKVDDIWWYHALCQGHKSHANKSHAHSNSYPELIPANKWGLCTCRLCSEQSLSNALGSRQKELQMALQRVKKAMLELSE